MKIYHDGIGEVMLVDSMGGDSSVVRAARVSHGEDAKVFDKERDARLIRFLAKHKHMSPFEHVQFTFKVVAPLFVAVQHMRHRTASYNMISRRYTSENIQFYIPDELHKQSTKDKQMSADPHVFSEEWLREMRQSSSAAFELYHRMINDGVAREEARMVLPQNVYTSYFVTVNLRNLHAFCILRMDDHAQFEIRRVAEMMADYAKDVVPLSWEALSNEC